MKYIQKLINRIY